MDAYWHMTPKLFNKYCNARKTENENRVKEIDSLNWVLGKYISYAVNKPEKYPSKPYLSGKQESKLDPSKVMSGEEMERMIKRNNIILGGKVNGRSK